MLQLLLARLEQCWAGYAVGHPAPFLSGVAVVQGPECKHQLLCSEALPDRDKFSPPALVPLTNGQIAC